MNLYVDLDALQLRASLTDARRVSGIEVKRGDALPLVVRFVQGGSQVRLDSTTVINFAIKENGNYDDDPLVLESSFSASTVEDPDSDPRYTATPSLNTTELNALFSIDGDSSNDPKSVVAMGELTWEATGDTGPTSTRTFSVTVENDVYRGSESTPTSQPTPEAWLTARNTERGIQPIRTGLNHLFPPSVTIDGEILGSGDVPITLEPLVYSSTDSNGYPQYSVTTAETIDLDLAWNNVSKEWDLTVDFGGSPATIVYESDGIAASYTDPTGVTLVEPGRTDVSITNPLGIVAPIMGDMGYIQSTGQTYIYDGIEWIPIGWLANTMTVSDLPDEGISEGRRLFVTDSDVAASGNFGAIVNDGGSNTVPVFSDGTDWRIG